MPLVIELQDYEGVSFDRLWDQHNLLARLLPLDDRSFCCLSYVPLWGDTVFNHLQMEVVLAEIERIMPRAATAEQRERFAAAREISAPVPKGAIPLSEVHRRLKALIRQVSR